MPLFLEGSARAAAKLGAASVPPVTLVGVAALAEPDLLVEIEATAVLD
jgi:enamine deaminase RidA (YjgF/YER057c/UK114 family)